MIKKSLLLSLAFLALLFTPSCETDVDINTDWKEITLVYGLLSQSDAVHYFRINKAYLGGNALEIAKIEDSSSYNGGLSVKLEGSLYGNIVQTVNFDTTTISNKDTGTFYNPYMLVYKGTATLNPDLLYTLNIKNNVSGQEITASTSLIHSFAITNPPGGGKATFLRDYTTAFEWDNAVNAIRYEPSLRFHYFEIPVGTTDTIPKYIDWVLPSQFADDVSGYGSKEMEISNNGFYDFIANNVKPVPYAGKRLCGTVDFMVAAGGEEYDTYMRVNGPSNSLVQDRPEYTNVENGFGLLSSRFNVSKNRRLHPFAEDEILLLTNKVEGEDVSLGFITNPNL